MDARLEFLRAGKLCMYAVRTYVLFAASGAAQQNRNSYVAYAVKPAQDIEARKGDFFGT